MGEQAAEGKHASNRLQIRLIAGNGRFPIILPTMQSGWGIPCPRWRTRAKPILNSLSTSIIFTGSKIGQFGKLIEP